MGMRQPLTRHLTSLGKRCVALPVRVLSMNAPAGCEEGQPVLPPGDQVQGVQRDAAGLGAEAAKIHRQPPVDEEPRVVGGGDGDPRAGLVEERRLHRHRTSWDAVPASLPGCALELWRGEMRPPHCSWLLALLNVVLLSCKLGHSP